ncbi:MAG: PEP-utilizing enzyme [bacterium]
MENKNLIKVKKIEWHYFNQRKRSPFFNRISIDSLVTKKIPLTDLESNAQNWLTIDGWGACPEVEFQHIRKWLVGTMEKDPKFLLKIIEAYQISHDKALKVWQEIQTQEWSNKTNEEMADALERYIVSRQTIDPWLNLPLLVEADLETRLKNDLSKIFPDDPGAFATLTSPIYPSAQAEELRERSKIKDSNDLEKHWQKYRWMSDTLMTLDYLPIEYFSQKEIIETTTSEVFNSYYDKIEDESVLTLIDTIQKSIWFRSFRIESFYYSSYLILNLLESIAKRCNISAKELMYLIPIEIVDLLRENRQAMQEKIQNRKYGFIQVWEPGCFSMHSGRQVDDWIKNINPGYHNIDQTISGQVAFSGMAKGRAIIIRSVDELPKLLEKANFGGVLVTHGTNPKYVPYLNKVSAIITDEGGILCHAAIIAREMKIPCIIGTKNATKVLKDGDIIMVDASHGKVTITKKA